MFETFRTTMKRPDRNLPIDYCRAIAILTVVLYHFDSLPFGYLGVDLFFLISGFLVSRPLLKAYVENQPIDVRSFIMRRAFKIWPSYYFFLLAGSGVAYLLYSTTEPNLIISMAHLPRYLFFYLNYRNLEHWTFDHTWSICVEEHFYILLPIAALTLSLVTRSQRLLALGLGAAIALGTTLKVIGYHFGFETYSATHNRIDALCLGVVLALLYHQGIVQKTKPILSALAVALGILGIIAAISLHADGSVFYQKVIFQSFIAFSTFVFLYGFLNLRLPELMPLRFIAYFSYNWYLWHPLYSKYILENYGTGLLGLCLYLSLSLASAVLVTVFIEEKMLNLRDKVFVRRFQPLKPTAHQ